VFFGKLGNIGIPTFPNILNLMNKLDYLPSKAATAGDFFYYLIIDGEKMEKNNISVEQQAVLYSYLTVKQFCEKHKAFKVGGIRSQIFNEHTNGLAKSGALVRNGRKVL